MSEVTDLFTTGAAIVLSGNGRERAKPRHRRASLLEHATRQPSRGRLHATMHAPAGVEPALSRAKYPRSSPPTNCIQGNERRRHRVDLQSKYPASSPPGIQNSPSFPHDKGFGEAGNKNPSGARLWRGSKLELVNGLSPVHLHEKARVHRRRSERMAQIRSATSVY